MTEVKKIVIEHYPVERLPDELRARLEAQSTVRLTIEPETEMPAEPRPLSELYGCAKGLYASQGLDPVEFIRQLRDEWD